MKRGDLVTVVTSGDYGKPPPALIVQADMIGRVDPTTLASVGRALAAFLEIG